ncbi:hypothetical protein ACOT81_21310 [Streptomyces sp. WI04-05B]|uniref:hypothetical protein n=1 Tax=Streptomyces TaxID=1883 RepID=UPI0029BC6193|nr:MULTISPECIES: hypothetical protein [unclassified Streptomyces]MDX2544160.1 hypothetical protein [Streptomyces sp. WI04-05B]MDX2584576.1 hypothetical protein [Streptomyces sp. WI04-05A]
MLISPRPGTDRKNIRQALSGVHATAMNLRRPYGSAFEGLLTYLEWVTESARILRSQISDRDLDQLVFTDRYRALLGSCGTLAGTAQQRLVNGVVQLEVDERVDAFEAAVAALDTQIGRWKQREVFVVADSSFYIQNEVKLADIDLHAMLDVPRWQFVRLLFPIVVVDELGREGFALRCGAGAVVGEAACLCAGGVVRSRCSEPADRCLCGAGSGDGRAPGRSGPRQ